MRGFAAISAALLLLAVGAQSASALSFALDGSSIIKINASMPGNGTQFYSFFPTGTFAFSMTVDSIEFSDAATQQMSDLGFPLGLSVNVSLDSGTGLYTNAAPDLSLLDLGNPVLHANFLNGGGQAAGLGGGTATLSGLYSLNDTIIQPDPTLTDAMFSGALAGQIDFTFTFPINTGVGLSEFSGGSFSMIPNPEPSTGLLLGMGLVGLVLKGRSRGRSNR